MEDKDQPFKEILHQNRINGFKRISKKIIEIISESKKKVSYTNKHCIITSWSYSNTNNEDLERTSKFGEQFMNNNFDASATTKQSFCRHTEQLFEDHHCTYCKCNDSTRKEGPSSEDDKSSSS
ncbi:hypothetical protein LXL04_037167 [Taraxacum kok-saghyz]